MADTSPNLLAQYLEEKDLSDRAFAEMVVATGQKCSRTYITQLRLGLRKAPSLGLAVKIATLTEGRVPVECWAEPPPETSDESEEVAA